MDAHRFLYDVYLVSACSSETSCEYNCKTSSKWIYGCDSCQDVCPMNKGKWKGMEDFPGLRDIALYLIFVTIIINTNQHLNIAIDSVVK